MKRRVIQIGDSTQLISLPRTWALQKGIKKGDELEISVRGDSLLIGADQTVENASVEIDVTGLDRTSIMFNIREAYRLGFDEIKILFNKPKTVHYRLGGEFRINSIIHTEVNRLVGVEIIEEKENYCIIRDLQTTSIKDFDVILKRIFLLLMSTSKDLLEGAKSGDLVKIGTIEEKHDTITKFISYCLRTLNKVGYAEPRKTPEIYHIIASLDIIGDIIKYGARDTARFKHAVHKETGMLLEKIHGSIVLYHDLFYKYSKEKIAEVSKNRDYILKDIERSPKNIPHEELLLLGNMEHICELVRDLVGSRMALEIR